MHRRTCRVCDGNQRLHRRAFGILQRQPQLLGQRLHRRPRFPGTLRFEPQVTDASTPRRNHPANGAEIRAIGMLLDRGWGKPNQPHEAKLEGSLEIILRDIAAEKKK